MRRTAVNTPPPPRRRRVTLKAFMAPIREHSRKVEMKYLRKRLASDAEIPEGKVVVHNSIVPVTGFGLHGSRSWMQFPDEKIEVCSCGWASQLSKHYRRRSPPSE
jgi:hypothetical protein